MFALVKVMGVERWQALVFDAQQDIYFIMSKCPVFVKTDGVKSLYAPKSDVKRRFYYVLNIVIEIME